MQYTNSDTDSIIYAIVIVIVIFIIIREFWLWYWKISENTSRIKNIDKNLQIIVDFLEEKTKNNENNLDNSQK